MFITPLVKKPIQVSLESLKGQYALENCQIPTSGSTRKTFRKACRDCRLSRGDPARYLRSGAGVRRIAGDRTAERDLFAVVSLDLGRAGANRRRDDDRHRADLQRSAESGRHPRDSGRPGHMGAAARRHPDGLDFASAAEGPTRGVGVPWSIRAGIDLALAMIEEDFGHITALDVARRLVVFLKRPGGQSQFSTVLAAQASDVEGRFSALHAWIIENIAGDLKVEALARKAGMTPRTFARAYVNRTGMTPASGVEALRVETARLLLESKEIRGVVEVAQRAGFGDDERMRRAFMRHLGVSPSEYRSRFSG